MTNQSVNILPGTDLEDLWERSQAFEELAACNRRQMMGSGEPIEVRGSESRRVPIGTGTTVPFWGQSCLSLSILSILSNEIPPQVQGSWNCWVRSNSPSSLVDTGRVEDHL
jgi:hypothetical protein